MSKNVLWRLAVVSICVALVLGMGAGCKGKKQAPLDTGITTGTGPETTSGDGQPDVDLENLKVSPT